MRMEQQRSERGTGWLTRHARKQSVDMVRFRSMLVWQPYARDWPSAGYRLVCSSMHPQHPRLMLITTLLDSLPVEYPVDQGCGLTCGLHFHILRPHLFPQAGVRTFDTWNTLT